MTYTTPIIVKYNLNTVNRVNYPSNLYISSLKIKNIRLYPKVISNNEILLYGDYEVVILYTFYNSKNTPKYFYRTYKCLINKIIFVPRINLLYKIKYNISIDTFNCPVCKYKLRENNNSFYDTASNNICTIKLCAYLQLTLTPRINYNDKELYKYVPLTCSNKIIENNYYNPITSNTKKKISTNIIIANGHEDFFINERFTLPPSSPEIMNIYKISIELLFSKLTPIDDYIIASGSYQISITYKTQISLECDESKGNLNYVYYIIPFDKLIRLKFNHGYNKISCNAKAEVLDYNCLGTTYTLINKLTNCNTSLLYNSINIQSVFRVRAIVISEEDIFL